VPAAEEWLLIEWPEAEAEPDHYWFSTLPADSSFESMVDQAKLRWRIERDYLGLKQEISLGHYEERGWRGFHHHAIIAALRARQSLVRRPCKDVARQSGWQPLVAAQQACSWCEAWRR